MNQADVESGSMQLPIVQLSAPPATSRKPGRGRRRAAVLIAVHVLILAHIVHFVLRGRSLSPVEPSESMYAIELGHLNAGTIFFGLAILATAVFGRFFCGWGCHLVALQDLCGAILRRLGIRFRPLRSRMLKCVPFVLAFYMFLWPTIQRIVQGTPHPGFSNHLITDNLWATFPGPGIAVLTLLVCGGLAVYLLGNKGFCTYACPYGAFFSVADRMAFGRIRATDACHQCGHCTAACTSNVRVHHEVRDHGMVVDSNCMKCMDCVSVCPSDALYFGLRSKPASSSTPVDDLPARERRPRRYDFSMAEDICALLVAALTVIALRGLYDGLPLLLSVAVGVISGLLSITAARTLVRSDVRLQSICLRIRGRLTFSGRIAAAVMLVWFGFVGHSGLVQFHRYQGRITLNRAQTTWADLLSAQSGLTRINPDDVKLARAARRSFESSDRIGLIDVVEVKVGLAWASLAENDVVAAERYLRQACALRPESDGVREMLMEFLASQNRPREAAELLQRLSTNRSSGPFSADR